MKEHEDNGSRAFDRSLSLSALVCMCESLGVSVYV